MKASLSKNGMPVNGDWWDLFVRLHPEIECGRQNIFIRSCSRSSDFERRWFFWKA
jgi:hypothetical protein